MLFVQISEVPKDFQTELTVQTYFNKGKFVIEVEENRFMRMWDVFTFSALGFTALVTPFEAPRSQGRGDCIRRMTA